MATGPFSAVDDLPASVDLDNQVDYFGFSDTQRYTLPDGKSWIEFKVFNEGDRRKFQNKTASDVKFNRSTGDATVRSAAGDQRFELLNAAITGWNLVRNGAAVPCSDMTKRQFLEGANPKVIDGIEKAIRLANPWLLADMSIEDIDKEIAALEEMKAKLLEEEAGKDA